MEEVGEEVKEKMEERREGCVCSYLQQVNPSLLYQIFYYVQLAVIRGIVKRSAAITITTCVVLYFHVFD